MKTVMALSLSIFFSSCMHLAMGTHGDHQTADHQAAAEPALKKEVVSGDIKATAVFPPLLLGKKSEFTLRLTDVASGRPISGALASFHATYLEKFEGRGEHDSHMEAGEDNPTHSRATANHAVSFDQDIQESGQPGLYPISFTAPQSGEYRLMFHVSANGDETLEPELVLETTRIVASTDMSDSEMTHGTDSTPDYVIIGAVLMGAMMLAMWAASGSMF